LGRQNLRRTTAKDALLKKQIPELRGWQAIADFLGQPVNVAQRWGREGMPVSRKGRYVIATPDELNSWLGRESGEPVHVATSTTDLASEMKRGLQFVRQQKGATKRRK
jgi:hypothetical protein